MPEVDELTARRFEQAYEQANRFYPISPGLREGLHRYVLERIPPGSFLTACLENDLHRAIISADFINLSNISNIILWIESAVPPVAKGSPSRVERWLRGAPEY